MSETKTAQFGIVNRIMEILKLDEAGRVEKFFAYKVKMHERAISQEKLNIEALKSAHNTNLEELEDNLEDAVANLYDVETAVTMDDIKTNDAIKSFSVEYDAAVSKAEDAFKEIEAEIKKAKDEYDEKLTSYKQSIKKREERIRRIKEGNN
jgi:septin family protein